MHRLMRALIFGLVLAAVGCTPGLPPSSVAAETGSSTAGETTTLTVFAAASLVEAFTEVGANFSATHPDVEVVFNFAGSQQLAQQLALGADADLFAAANGKQMMVAVEAGRVVGGTAKTFIHNRLVVITPKENPAQLTTLQDLAKPGLQLILAAKQVPVGQYALDFLEKAAADGAFGAAYQTAVLTNVVSYEENVRAVLTKVTLGEADAGIVYTSDVTVSARAQVQRIEIPDALNTIAAYPIAVISNSAHPPLAQQFVDFVFSPEGQAVLVKYGFISVDTN